MSYEYLMGEIKGVLTVRYVMQLYPHGHPAGILWINDVLHLVILLVRKIPSCIAFVLTSHVSLWD